MVKSPNKYNRLYVIAEPLNEDLVKEIEDGNIKPSDDYKVTTKTLIDKYVGIKMTLKKYDYLAHIKWVQTY